MDKQDSGNDDVVFTRFEEAEKGEISDLEIAIRNSLLARFIFLSTSLDLSLPDRSLSSNVFVAPVHI